MNCIEPIVISSITVANDIMTLTSTDTPTLKNGRRYLLVIPEALIPTLETIDAIQVGIGGTGYYLQERCLGNYTYSDQLRFIPTSCKGNKVLRIVYGTAPAHFKIISQCLPKSSAV